MVARSHSQNITEDAAFAQFLSLWDLVLLKKEISHLYKFTPTTANCVKRNVACGLLLGIPSNLEKSLTLERLLFAEAIYSGLVDEGVSAVNRSLTKDQSVEFSGCVDELTKYGAGKPMYSFSMEKLLGLAQFNGATGVVSYDIFLRSWSHIAVQKLLNPRNKKGVSRSSLDSHTLVIAKEYADMSCSMANSCLLTNLSKYQDKVRKCLSDAKNAGIHYR
jgi:hypothetical protein